MDLSERLHELSKEKGLTQADVARRSGLSTAKITQLFRGSTKDPRISTVMMLCQALEVPLDELIDIGEMQTLESESDTIDLKTRLQQLSSEMNLTQADIARRSGLSTATVAQLFVGKSKNPKATTLLALCQAFEMTPSEFLEGVEIPE